jgi:hypothetical protein
LKAFEAIFFLSFLALYYAVLVPIQRNGHDRSHPPIGQPPFRVNNGFHLEETDRQKSFHHITAPEVLLFLWIAGFAYDECMYYPCNVCHIPDLHKLANIVMLVRHSMPQTSGACTHFPIFLKYDSTLAEHFRWDIGIVAIGVAFFITSKFSKIPASFGV